MEIRLSPNRRHAASVNNGRKSRGPTTPEGKARSAMNALRHGLLAQNVLVGTESRENFDLLVKQHLDRFGPLDGVEFTVVEDMIAANWRLQRGRAIEKTWLNQTLAAGPKTDGMSQISIAYATLSATDKYKNLQRYETRLYNMYQRSLKTLLLLRQFDNNDDSESAGNLEPAPTHSLDTAAGQTQPAQTEPAPESASLALIPSAPPPSPLPARTGPDYQTNLVPKSNTIQSEPQPVLPLETADSHHLHEPPGIHAAAGHQIDEAKPLSPIPQDPNETQPHVIVRKPSSPLVPPDPLPQHHTGSPAVAHQPEPRSPGNPPANQERPHSHSTLTRDLSRPDPSPALPLPPRAGIQPDDTPAPKTGRIRPLRTSNWMDVKARHPQYPHQTRRNPQKSGAVAL